MARGQRGRYLDDKSERPGLYINVSASSSSSSSLSGCPSQYSDPESASSVSSTATSRRSSTTLLSASTSATSIVSSTNDTMLQCTFHEIGCKLQFGSYAMWYSHCLSHWNGHPPPRECLCIFCDEQFRGNNGWHNRMSHIARHLSDGLIIEGNSRPDFAMYRYMFQKQLLSKSIYKKLAAYSECESAPCLGLLPLDYQKVPSENHVEYYDQAREDRLRERQRKALQKGKNRELRH